MRSTDALLIGRSHCRVAISESSDDAMLMEAQYRCT